MANCRWLTVSGVRRRVLIWSGASLASLSGRDGRWRSRSAPSPERAKTKSTLPALPAHLEDGPGDLQEGCARAATIRPARPLANRRLRPESRTGCRRDRCAACTVLREHPRRQDSGRSRRFASGRAGRMVAARAHLLQVAGPVLECQGGRQRALRLRPAPARRATTSPPAIPTG